MDAETAPAKYPYVKRRKRQLVILAGVYLGLAGLTLLARGLSEVSSRGTTNAVASRTLTKRSVINGSRYGLQGAGGLQETDEDSENCTPRAIYEFPDNFFSLYDTQHGGVVIHILLALYMFCALAIVCDDYFVASLEMICDNFGLQEDVAGATLMAAGSSAPELCTSVIGVFIAQSDVGTGTIVGSAVFNILFIIAICALFSGMVVTLTWWPMTRDCAVYLLSVLCLIGVMNDGLIYWYEALVMLILYILYIVIMYFNRRLEGYFTEKAKKIKFKWLMCSHEEPKEKNPLLHKPTVAAPNGTTPNGSIPNGINPPDVTESLKNVTIEQETQLGPAQEEDQNEKTHAHEVYDSPWDIPEGFAARVFWVGMVPVKALLFVTIPDCRRPGTWQKLYPLTFLMSIVWIAGFSYLMVWMVTITGDALGIPDTVMGLTFLAAGTSVPDALSSLFVSRDGLGDMAVSNSIGSNVFDILMCLGLPWFLKTVAVESGEPVAIASHGLLFSAITLLTTVAFVLIATHLSHWRLTKWVGVLFLVVYVVVITFACLYELNVFGDLNLPTCPRR